MIFTSRYIDKQFLVRGELSVPLQIASYQCEYKYVILNEGDDPTYEEIIEYQWKWRERGGYLNRYLDINTKNLSENSKFFKKIVSNYSVAICCISFNNLLLQSVAYRQLTNISVCVNFGLLRDCS